LTLKKQPGKDEISVLIAGGENIKLIIQIFVNKCINKSYYPSNLENLLQDLF
jgi:hypothetical protein